MTRISVGGALGHLTPDIRHLRVVANSTSGVHRIAMRLLVGVWVPVSALLSIGGMSTPQAPTERVELVQASSGVQVDVNRPRSPFDCELPMGTEWYGSRDRCLQYLCGGKNVYNEYIFDQDNRRRKNPCFGQSPTDFGEKFD